MTTKEMIDKLSTLPPETIVIWEDTIEGNDCEVDGIYVLRFHPVKGETDEKYAYITPSLSERGKVL
ncbi:hypothetical protein LCGC14_0932800 [marine sediment metagenome]|uniref:Uncharacterized protein n=1 Tax=marine sediment metagenome TaxID=412755 RepID=A0A0F9RTY7_9ZZZZ